MVKVAEHCVGFLTEYPFAIIGAVFLVLCIVIPHLIVTDFYTTVNAQESERSISYNLTFKISWIMVGIFAIFSWGLIIGGCYSFGTNTFWILIFFPFLTAAICYINNSNYSDKPEHWLKVKYPNTQIADEIILYAKKNHYNKNNVLV